MNQRAEEKRKYCRREKKNMKCSWIIHGLIVSLDYNEHSDCDISSKRLIILNVSCSSTIYFSIPFPGTPNSLSHFQVVLRLFSFSARKHAAAQMGYILS